MLAIGFLPNHCSRKKRKKRKGAKGAKGAKGLVLWSNIRSVPHITVLSISLSNSIVWT